MNRFVMKFLLGIITLSCCLPQSVIASTEQGEWGLYDEIDFYADDTLSFEYVTNEVFKPRCYQCHSTAGGDRDGVNLETYSNVYALRFKIREMALVKKTMPPKSAGGPLNAREMDILSRWLDAGAPEKDAMDPPQPEDWNGAG